LLGKRHRKAVSSTRYTAGSTNTAGGLRTAWEVFNSGLGGRQSAEDIVIDEESNTKITSFLSIQTEKKVRNLLKKIIFFHNF
jgi:hypothetical protein